jgi:uncharacterized protein (TIGR03118 family)
LAWAQNAYVQQNLVSDIPGLAANTDTNLLNPWGLAFSGNSPFWISDNHSGLSTLYNGSGTPLSLIVTIPPPAGGSPPAAPTGLVFNGSTNFIVASNVTARFIFSTEDGTIVGWNSASGPVLKVDNSAAGTVYKGLALASSGGSNYLYATDFHNGRIDVFDANYNPVTLAGSFADASLPAGFAPFGITTVNGQLFVTYALQDANRHDDVQGPGNGFINVFDTSGVLVSRFASTNALNSPWGLAKAPASFGPFGNDLLVGNFGDGHINVYDPGNGDWLGALNDSSGTNLVAIIGLWALAFGNGANAGSTNTLYFTAGIPGPGALEDHGLLGGLSPVFPAATIGATFSQHNLVSDLPGLADHMDTNLVNPWGIAFSATSPFWISDNHSGFSTIYNSSGTPSPLVVTIPPPNGGTPPAAPDGIVFNGTTDFVASGTSPARFIFATEDGTISGWAGGSSAVLKADNSTSGTVYKGLAMASSGGNNFLYAADFHNGRIDVFDASYNPATLAGNFADPTIPAGFAPFNIQNIGGQLFVTYAMQDADRHDDVGGPGHGYVNVFDTSGHLLRRFASQGVLDSPWGLAMAPAGFGAFGGALLIGNFSDGRINAFDPVSGNWLGAVLNVGGTAFAVPGLWGLAFGNGGSGGDTHTLYFTAGINGENDGLFGSLSPTVPTFFAGVDKGIGVQLNWAGGTAPFLLQKKASLAETNWFDVLTTSNRSVIVTKESDANLYRVSDQATTTVLPFSALLSGESEVPAVVTTGSGRGTISLEGSNLTYQISFSGLSGPAIAAHFHLGASPTNTSNTVLPLTVPAATSGTISGSMLLTPDQAAIFLGGMAYVNIHTANNGGGEIRSQIVPLRMSISLNGANEVPPVTTTATGTGSLTLIGNQLFYDIHYSGLAGPATLAHIHGPADPSTSASPLVPLATPSGTSGSIGGLVSLDPTNLTYLLSGLTYINIHSTTNAGGEIRGQIWPVQLGASLSGAAEIPAVASGGSGSGVFTILNNTLSYNVTFTNLTSNATASHLHGPADATQTASPMIFFSNVPSATSGTISGTTSVTSQQFLYLMEGLMYANIHTVNNGGGEIRGQAIPQN